MNRIDFYAFCYRELEGLGLQLSHSSLANRRTALRSLSEFTGPILPFSGFTRRLVSDWCQYLRRTRRLGENTVHAYCRSLRALYNRAVDRGAVRRPSVHPFEGVSTGVLRTRKRAVSLGAVASVVGLCVRPGSWEELARDLFEFSFCAGGMPPVDMAFLRWEQVDWRRGLFTYRRCKTGRSVSVTLVAPLVRILRRYRDSGRNGYVFPLVSSPDRREAMRQYRSRLTLYNRALQRLAVRAGAPHLSSYVARHTWASYAHNELGQPLPRISRMLGHGSERTTGIYISEIDDSRVFAAQRRVARDLVRALSRKGSPITDRQTLFEYKGTSNFLICK